RGVRLKTLAPWTGQKREFRSLNTTSRLRGCAQSGTDKRTRPRCRSRSEAKLVRSSPRGNWKGTPRGIARVPSLRSNLIPSCSPRLESRRERTRNASHARPLRVEFAIAELPQRARKHKPQIQPVFLHHKRRKESKDEMNERKHPCCVCARGGRGSHKETDLKRVR